MPFTQHRVRADTRGDLDGADLGGGGARARGRFGAPALRDPGELGEHPRRQGVFQAAEVLFTVTAGERERERGVGGGLGVGGAGREDGVKPGGRSPG